ncbi:hypothetical protein B0H14DRAFT_375608 [Mycena olivaceomarginata]|nr:hypothetical protein B0H14DRAFT_375608 [Mycena olivaceomarginata]
MTSCSLVAGVCALCIRTESTSRCAVVSSARSRVGGVSIASCLRLPAPAPIVLRKRQAESPTAAAPAASPDASPPACPCSRPRPQLHLAASRPHRGGRASQQNWCHRPRPRAPAPAPPCASVPSPSESTSAPPPSSPVRVRAGTPRASPRCSSWALMARGPRRPQGMSPSRWLLAWERRAGTTTRHACRARQAPVQARARAGCGALRLGLTHRFSLEPHPLSSPAAVAAAPPPASRNPHTHTLRMRFCAFSGGRRARWRSGISGLEVDSGVVVEVAHALEAVEFALASTSAGARGYAAGRACPPAPESARAVEEAVQRGVAVGYGVVLGGRLVS